MIKKLHCQIVYRVESKNELQVTNVKINEKEERIEAINTLLNYLNCEDLKLVKILSLKWY